VRIPPPATQKTEISELLVRFVLFAFVLATAATGMVQRGVATPLIDAVRQIDGGTRIDVPPASPLAILPRHLTPSGTTVQRIGTAKQRSVPALYALPWVLIAQAAYVQPHDLARAARDSAFIRIPRPFQSRAPPQAG